MMDLGVKYSGAGSYADPVQFPAVSPPSDVIGRDITAGTAAFSSPNSAATSWASALVLAAEAALRKEGIEEKISLLYVLQCLKESLEVEAKDVSPADLIAFVAEKGLMTEAAASELSMEALCSAKTPKFYFEVERNEAPNASGLKRFVAEGKPVIVLLALDLVRLKTANDVTGDAIYTGATEQPSLYGVVKGFDEKKWIVTFNVVPCENIEMNLPVIANETNANYAGIAGYAFSLKAEPISTEFVVDDSVGSLGLIPSWATKIVIKQGSFNTITEMRFDFPELRSLVFEDNTCANVQFIEINAPLLEELIIGENCFSGLPASRRLMDLIGKFVLNTPLLKIVSVRHRSLWNLHTLVLIQINVDTRMELVDFALNGIVKIQYKVDLPFEKVMYFKITIEGNVGHEGDILLEPLDPPTSTPPTTEPPTEAPTPLTCDEGLTYYSIRRYYGLSPNSSEILTLFSGYADVEIVSMVYQGNSVDVFEGCAEPHMMRIVLDGWEERWNEDSYFVIQSEFGTSDKISLRETTSRDVFFHVSKGIIEETRVSTCQEFSSLENSVQILHIEENACNEESYVSFLTERFSDLMFLWIESNNFQNVSTFSIRNHALLSHILIEQNAFTEQLFSFGNDTAKSFSIVNCTHLISIQIGPYSFSDYAGPFVLQSLPLLRSLLIGSVNHTSYNFYSSSFTIIGSFDFLLVCSLRRPAQFGNDLDWRRIVCGVRAVLDPQFQAPRVPPHRQLLLPYSQEILAEWTRASSLSHHRKQFVHSADRQLWK